MQNGVKNGEKTQFSSINQPSSQAKSAGWSRKRMAREFLDKIFEYQDMSVSEFNELVHSMDKNPKDRTMRELMAVRYVEKLVKSDKVLIDWINRHIPKTEIDENEDRKIDEVIITVINEHKKFDDADIPPV